MTGGSQDVPALSKNLLCHYCKEPGHYKRNCPKLKSKLAMINLESESEEDKALRKIGTIDGRPCKCLIDMGANRTTVPAHLIQPNKFTGVEEKAVLATNGVESLRTAKVDLKIEGISHTMLVFVIDKDASHVLLGTDHPFVKCWITRRSLPELSNTPVPLAAITRAQNQALEMEDASNQVASTQSGAKVKSLSPEQPKVKPKPIERQVKSPKTSTTGNPGPSLRVQLGDEREEECINNSPGEDEVSATTDEYASVGGDEEEDPSVLVEEVVLNGLEEGQSCDQPTPVLSNSEEEVRKLVTQQEEDSSLLEMSNKAAKQEDGYCWENGVLVHVKLVEPQKELSRIVVPSCRRKEVLDIGHRGLVGGHFSHNKMFAILSHHFTWPGIRKDIRSYCRACPECQKAGRQLQPRVPMVVTPTISEPYQRMAWDLVGQLDKTNQGHRYILTIMCLGTRYPYAIPLKWVDAESVAEGLMEVISHTGIPVELLSDQGSVFLGKVIKELCRLLNIKQIKTTAYHPQTNGILERWHSCLKGMIRKIQGKSQQWDKLLKYCLLAYRATPHTATGFSPYELVHGKSMRGPLEAVKVGWIGGDISFTSTVEWVQALRETLVSLHKVAHANEEVAKDKSKTAYDVGSKARSFEPGDLVLCHTPGLTGKLQSIWDGPYEVVAKLSNCNYTIAVKGKRSRHTTVHINRLKAWKTPTANLFQVVVTDEFEVNPEPIGKVKMGVTHLTKEQRLELDRRLAKFSDRVTHTLGVANFEENDINVKEGYPLRTRPYRIAPGMFDDLKGEIDDDVISKGIIVPSRSPWSSPMVPLRKKSTGHVRLCIDYRKLNKITISDPYQMPCIEDLLNQVSDAVWLSKLDLNKGFYQVPLSRGSQDKTAFCTP